MTPDERDDFPRRLRRAHLCARLSEGVVEGFARGAFASTLILLVLRAFSVPSAGLTVLALTGPIIISIAFHAIRALKLAPSPAAARALADDLSHAGGLVLVAGLPGAEAWTPPPAPPIRVWPRLGRRLCVATLATACAFAVAAAPADWFAAPAKPTANPAPLTEELRNEIEALRENETLPPEELEECERQLDRIEEAADPANPAETLAALERLENRLTALLDLDAETRRRLASPNALSENQASGQCANDFAQALSDMLANAPSTDDPTEDWDCDGEGEGGGEGEGEGGDGDGGGDGGGDGDGVGSGAPSRGRADAPIDWKDATKPDGVRFRDEAERPNHQPGTQLEKIGESISDEDPSRNAPSSSGRVHTQIGGTATGTAVSRPISPRHRATVKRFFDPEPQSGGKP